MLLVSLLVILGVLLVKSSIDAQFFEAELRLCKEKVEAAKADPRLIDGAKKALSLAAKVLKEDPPLAEALLKIAEAFISGEKDLVGKAKEIFSDLPLASQLKILGLVQKAIAVPPPA